MEGPGSHLDAEPESAVVAAGSAAGATATTDLRCGVVCRSADEAVEAARILLAGRTAAGSVFDIDGTLLDLLAPPDVHAIGAERPAKVVAPLPEHFKFLRLARDAGARQLHVVTARTRSRRNWAAAELDLQEAGVAPTTLQLMTRGSGLQLLAKTTMRKRARRGGRPHLINVGDRLTDLADATGMLRLVRDTGFGIEDETWASDESLRVDPADAERLFRSAGAQAEAVRACVGLEGTYAVMTGYDEHSLVQIKVPAWGTGLV